MGTTRRRGREGTDRWFVSQHSLPAQQERDSQAKVVGLVRRASTFGLRLSPWSVDMAGVRRRKRELVNGMIAIHKAQFAANGLEFILGEGRFVGPKTIEVRLTQGGRRCAAPSDP